MKQLNLKVEGMHCKSCETLLTDELQEAGAKDIKISFSKGTVAATIDEKTLTEAKVRKIIEKEGYKVQ
ncbi:heavy-metal-associated domain-containing protein [Candidatus Woesearchaeota archaeon]|nr:heavy-metal-associated domain-containing protein [Candidatus Woesearchaeota archaeon]